MGVNSRVGVVIRDMFGRVIAALYKSLPSQFPVDWTNLYALEQGIMLAQEMELSQVIFELDALLAIHAIHQGITGGEVGHLVEGILQAKASFSCYSFNHLKRDYNRIAHKLAQFAKINHCTQVWKGVSPPFVSHLILSDLEPPNLYPCWWLSVIASVFGSGELDNDL
ncbi:uncharacterized protein LOC126719304 [Quercus robur]|uniref:uncharacterized protein LOC126719304 n=1 Tax=Quercus robur TaxID=38942 RepID=UPI002161701C|nr:uncharacterized protein LOC126719304 [Quercus robur]